MKPIAFSRYVLANISAFALILVLAQTGSSQIVYNLNDSGPGSLRQALASASDGGYISVLVTGTVFTASTLGIGKNVRIGGPGPRNFVVAADNTTTPHRVFGISGNVVMWGLTISNGLAAETSNYFTPDGGWGSGSLGGGIYHWGSLTLSNCVLVRNRAVGTNGRTADIFTTYGTNGTAGLGGAIFSYGTLRLDSCTLQDNAAIGGNGGNGQFAPGNGWGGGSGGEAFAGAIYVQTHDRLERLTERPLTMINCTLSGNKAIGGSGGSGGYGYSIHISGSPPIHGVGGNGGDGGRAYAGALYNAVLGDADFNPLLINCTV